ncbi:MAG TPA: hypothetical protein PLQ88_34485, partial [Blastocatellia bacterium]|nr:hypothetical protein [Blastocatellia bacterium]
LELYQRPYFLRLLCEQVTLTGGEIPQSRAELFTGFVRHALQEEIRKNSDLLRPCELLTEEDFLLLNGAQKYAGTFGLPEEGALIPKLSELAFQMQQQGAQVRLAKKQARELLAHERAGTILKLGLSLNVLDDDSAGVRSFISCCRSISQPGNWPLNRIRRWCARNGKPTGFIRRWPK